MVTCEVVIEGPCIEYPYAFILNAFPAAGNALVSQQHHIAGNELGGTLGGESPWARQGWASTAGSDRLFYVRSFVSFDEFFYSPSGAHHGIGGSTLGSGSYEEGSKGSGGFSPRQTTKKAPLA